MTPELKPDERGVPRPPDQVAEGDRVLIHEDDGIVAIGRVIDFDGVPHCQGATPGALHRIGVRDQYVRLLRPPDDVRIPDGTPVHLRVFDAEWATLECEGTIKAAVQVEGAMRYNVRYQVPKSFANLGGFAVALGVHPDDIELRPTGEDEPKFAPDDDAETQLRTIDTALFNGGVPLPPSVHHTVAQRVQMLVHLWRELNAPAPDGTLLNPHLVNEQSTALRDISRLAVQHGANEAKTVYRQVVEALQLAKDRTTTSAGTAGRVALRREVEVALGNYGRPKPTHWQNQRGDVMEWLDHALCRAREQERELIGLAGYLCEHGATPSDTIGQMVETVLAKTRAEARANATQAAENAAAARIEKAEAKAHQCELDEQQARETLADTEHQHQELFRMLSYAEPYPHGVDLIERLSEVMEAFRARIKALEADKKTLLGQVGEAAAAPDKIREHSLEAMSLLAQRIPGVQGFTLPQKLREVLAFYDNRISELELAVVSRKPKTVIAGADRVRAVVAHALSDRVGWAVENLNKMLNDDHEAVGGWFLRTLANANLAVIVYNWDGLDPTAEPVEPHAEKVTEPVPPTLDDVKAAWDTMVTQIAKVPQVLRDALKDLP